MDITLILIIVFVLFVTFAAILRRYKRCPSDKILVIYGKTGKNKSGSISSARCIHGGAAFIWPVFQDDAFLDTAALIAERAGADGLRFLFGIVGRDHMYGSDVSHEIAVGFRKGDDHLVSVSLHVGNSGQSGL